MSGPPAVPDRGSMRASDADRERVANVLREAAGDGRLTMEELDERLDAVYAAKTYAELEPITRDLPATGTAHAPVPAQSSAVQDSRIGGVASSEGAFAILGGFSRKGDWVVPKDFTAFAFMAGGEIDLREARFAEPVVTLHVVAIMGGFDHGASATGAPGGPTIVINGVALMGGVEVRRRPLRQSRRERLESRR